MLEKLAGAMEPTNGLRKAPFPPVLTKFRSFLADRIVYRLFVHAYLKIEIPLTEMLRKDKNQNWDNPT